MKASVAFGLLVHGAAAASLQATLGSGYNLEQADHLTHWGVIVAGTRGLPLELLQEGGPADPNGHGRRQHPALTSTISAQKLAWRAWARSAGTVPDKINREEDQIARLEDENSQMAVRLRKLNKASERSAATAAALETQYGQDQTLLLRQQHELVHGFREIALGDARRQELNKNATADAKTLDAARQHVERLRKVSIAKDATETKMREQLASLRDQLASERSAAVRKDRATEQELRNGTATITRAQKRARALEKLVAALRKRIASAGDDKARLRQHRSELLNENARLLAESDRLAGLQRGQRAALEALEHEAQDDRHEQQESQHELDDLEGGNQPTTQAAVVSAAPTLTPKSMAEPDVQEQRDFENENGDIQELDFDEDADLAAKPEAAPPEPQSQAPRGASAPGGDAGSAPQPLSAHHGTALGNRPYRSFEPFTFM